MASDSDSDDGYAGPHRIDQMCLSNCRLEACLLQLHSEKLIERDIRVEVSYAVSVWWAAWGGCSRWNETQLLPALSLIVPFCPVCLSHVCLLSGCFRLASVTIDQIFPCDLHWGALVFFLASGLLAFWSFFSLIKDCLSYIKVGSAPDSYFRHQNLTSQPSITSRCLWAYIDHSTETMRQTSDH